MKMKFKLKETVFARKSGKKGAVEAIHIDESGVTYGVRNDGTKTKPFRYAEKDLESVRENAVRIKAEARAAAAAAKAKAKADREKAADKAKAKPVAKAKVKAKAKAKAKAKTVKG